MIETLEDENGNLIDVTGYTGPSEPRGPVKRRRRGLYELSLDFEWHTGIPVVPVLLTLAAICSIAAIRDQLDIRPIGQAHSPTSSKADDSTRCTRRT